MRNRKLRNLVQDNAPVGDPCVVSCRNCLKTTVWHHFSHIVKPRCQACGSPDLHVRAARPGVDYFLLDTGYMNKVRGRVEFRAEGSQWNSQLFPKSSAPAAAR